MTNSNAKRKNVFNEKKNKHTHTHTEEKHKYIERKKSILNEVEEAYETDDSHEEKVFHINWSKRTLKIGDSERWNKNKEMSKVKKISNKDTCSKASASEVRKKSIICVTICHRMKKEIIN